MVRLDAVRATRSLANPLDCAPLLAATQDANAHVILAADADNVSFVRAAFAAKAEKAVQLAQFVRFAPLDGDFETQLGATRAHEPSPEFNVEDPAGADQPTYDACARQLWDLAQAFGLLVGAERVD